MENKKKPETKPLFEVFDRVGGPEVIDLAAQVFRIGRRPRRDWRSELRLVEPK